jgi:citrate lyase beta subunit
MFQYLNNSRGLAMNQGKSRCSILAVPGKSEKMIGKALDFQTDQLFLNLEDAVAPESKLTARSTVANTLAQVKEGVTRGIDKVILPKVPSAKDLQWWIENFR